MEDQQQRQDAFDQMDVVYEESERAFEQEEEAAFGDDMSYGFAQEDRAEVDEPVLSDEMQQAIPGITAAVVAASTELQEMKREWLDERQIEEGIDEQFQNWVAEQEEALFGHGPSSGVAQEQDNETVAFVQKKMQEEADEQARLDRIMVEKFQKDLENRREARRGF